MTDPRDLTEATDDEVRAAQAAAEVRIHRTPDGDSADLDEHGPEAVAPDSRDPSHATDEEARAAAAAMRERIERSAERDRDATPSVEPDPHG